MIVIIVSSEQSEPKTYQFDGDLVRIGRAAENDLVLANRTCSRHHAEISKENETYRIVDLGSTNGIRFGSEKVQELELEHGTIIGLGQYTLTISLPGQHSAETVAIPIMSGQRSLVPSQDSVTDVELQPGKTQSLQLPGDIAIAQQQQRPYLVWLKVALFLLASVAFVLAVMIALRYLTDGSDHPRATSILDAVGQLEPNADTDHQAVRPSIGTTEGFGVRVAPVELYGEPSDRSAGAGSVMVPDTALFNELDNQAEAFVVRDQHVHLVSVTVGRHLDHGTEVLQGLAPGDMIVIDRPADLTDGQIVTVIQ